MRPKRKHGDQQPPRTYFIIFLLGGLIFLGVISVYGTYSWYTSRSISTIEPGVTKANPAVTIIPQVLPETKPAAQTIPINLFYSTSDGTIGNFSDTLGARSTTLNGQDVAVAVDGQTLAYTRDGKLFVFVDGSEHLIGLDGQASMPSWNVDGSLL